MGFASQTLRQMQRCREGRCTHTHSDCVRRQAARQIQQKDRRAAVAAEVKRQSQPGYQKPTGAGPWVLLALIVIVTSGAATNANRWFGLGVLLAWIVLIVAGAIAKHMPETARRPRKAKRVQVKPKRNPVPEATWWVSAGTNTVEHGSSIRQPETANSPQVNWGADGTYRMRQD